MSLPRLFPRCVKAASTTTTACLRRSAARCPQCQRPFSSFLPLRQESRRRLQTVSAYQPSTLDVPPPPPRSAGGPETSISAPKATTTAQKEAADTSRIAVTEETAQHEKRIPQPEAAATLPPSSTQSTAATPTQQRTRPKLRPRKAAMTLTPSAVSHLRDLVTSEGKLIRIGVRNRGCSGLAYNLEYVEKPGAFDETVEQDGVKVLIDSKALFSIIGSEMDWAEDKLSARFVFKNPNITDECGCGESFSVGR